MTCCPYSLAEILLILDDLSLLMSDTDSTKDLLVFLNDLTKRSRMSNKRKCIVRIKIYFAFTLF